MTNLLKRSIICVLRVVPWRWAQEVKRRDLVDLMLEKGWKLKRHGSDHDVYQKGEAVEVIPRHTEVDEYLAKAIIKRRHLK